MSRSTSSSISRRSIRFVSLVVDGARFDEVVYRLDHVFFLFEREVPGEFVASVGDVVQSAGCPLPCCRVDTNDPDLVNEHDPDDGAVDNRDARFAYGAAGKWAPDDPDGEQYRQWVRDAGDQLRPFSTGSNYINFRTADEGEERIWVSYGDNYDRLVALKTRYDPENLVRVNRNIQPSGSQTGLAVQALSAVVQTLFGASQLGSGRYRIAVCQSPSPSD